MDLAGTESLAVLALKAVQAVPHPVLGAGGMTVPHARVETTSVHGFVATTIVQPVHRGRAATTIVPHVRVAMMTALGSAAMMTVHRGRAATTIVPHVRVVRMTVHGSVVTMIAPHVRVEMMIDRVAQGGMIRVHGSVVTMIDLLGHGETMPVPVVLELQRNSAQMKFATRVAVAA